MTLLSRLLLFCCLFLSGGAAIALELIWTKQCAYITGVSATALCLVLVVFMAGLFFGSLAMSHLLKEGNLLKQFKPVLFLATCEILTAIFAFLVGTNLKSFVVTSASAYTMHSTAMNSLAAIVIILPTTFFMGMNFPLFVEIFSRAKTKVSIEFLYALNLSGAALSALFLGSYMLEKFGLQNCTNFACLALCLNALLLFTVHSTNSWTNRVESIAQEDKLNNDRANSSILKPGYLIYLSFMSGFLAMVIEVNWTRMLTISLGPSVYSFSLVLFIFLLCLTISALITPKLIGLFGSINRVLQTCLLGFCFSLSVSLNIFNIMPELNVRLSHCLATISGAALNDFNSFVNICQLSQLLSTLIFLFPSCFFAGLLLPILWAQIKHSQKATTKIAFYYAINTAGAILGILFVTYSAYFTPFTASSFLFDFSLLPVLLLPLILPLLVNMQKNMRIATAITLALCFGLLISANRDFNYKIFVTGLNEFISPRLIAQSPTELNKSIASYYRQINGEKLNYYAEGLNCVVSVAELQDKNIAYLKCNGLTQGALPLNSALPSYSDLKTQVYLGSLPSLLSNGKAKNAALIGWGTGISASTILDHGMDKLDVFEIEPKVYTASKYLPKQDSTINKAETSEKSHLYYTDARTYLAYCPSKYDAIVSQPFEPWVSGSSQCFSAEFFKIVQAHLTDRGMFCQWIQLYGMREGELAVVLNTISSVFPHCLIFHLPHSGEIIIVCKNTPFDITQISQAEIRKTIIADNMGINKFRSRFGQQEPGIINTDDNLWLEFSMAKSRYLGEATIESNLALLSACQNNNSEVFSPR